MADLTNVFTSVLLLPALSDLLPPNIFAVSIRRLNHSLHQQYADRTRVDCRDWLPLWAVKEGAEEAARGSDRGTKQQNTRRFWHAIVESGNTDSLQLLASRGGSAWDRGIYEAAAAAGLVHVMGWALRSDCPLNEYGDELWDQTEDEFKRVCTEAAASHGRVHMLQWLDSNGRLDASAVCRSAAAGGQLGVLQWARTRRPACPWDAVVCSKAAEFGQLAALKWLRAEQCPWDKHVCSKAAWGGHQQVLEWAHAHGCPWDASTCFSAGTQGHLALLEWARKQGCPCVLDERFAAAVAKNGQLRVLKWARRQSPPCPWDEEVTTGAAVAGHLELLQWAVDRGCPFSSKVRDALRQGRRKHPAKGRRKQPAKGLCRVWGVICSGVRNTCVSRRCAAAWDAGTGGNSRGRDAGDKPPQRQEDVVICALRACCTQGTAIGSQAAGQLDRLKPFE